MRGNGAQGLRILRGRRGPKLATVIRGHEIVELRFFVRACGGRDQQRDGQARHQQDEQEPRARPPAHKLGQGARFSRRSHSGPARLARRPSSVCGVNDPEADVFRERGAVEVSGRPFAPPVLARARAPNLAARGAPVGCPAVRPPGRSTLRLGRIRAEGARCSSVAFGLCASAEPAPAGPDDPIPNVASSFRGLSILSRPPLLDPARHAADAEHALFAPASRPLGASTFRMRRRPPPTV